MVKSILIFLSFLFLSSCTISQEADGSFFSKDLLCGSWMSHDVRIIKYSNAKRVYYYQSLSIYQFEKDSFKRVNYSADRDTDLVTVGTYYLCSDTLVLYGKDYKGKNSKYIYRIEVVADGIIDIVGRFDHSSHYRLTKLDILETLDTFKINSILSKNICKIENESQSQEGIERSKKIEPQNTFSNSRLFLYTVHNSSGNMEQSRLANVNSKLVFDEHSNNSFLLFSNYQKAIQILEVSNDSIIGIEIGKGFEKLKIYPVDSIGLPEDCYRKWEVYETNGLKEIEAIEINKDTVYYQLSNRKIDLFGFDFQPFIA
ncbi:MAG TPA: hypothetical protein ENJ95_20060, partial [Bacteroidetes bacterium]|nr:hypothetical protein [Bacteroidota bacterium]